MKRITLSVAVLAALTFALIPATGARNGDDLAGTEWQLISVNDSPVLDSTVTLLFGDDGRAFGSSGCNSYITTYTLAGSSISFSQAASTMKACAEDVMGLEATYLAALGAATGYEVSDEQLVIAYGSGERLVFAPLASLSGTKWQLLSYGGNDVIGDEPITLEFAEDGRVGGSTGCNLYGGSYLVEGSAISFSELINTLRACPDEDIAAQELAFLGALAAATHFELADEQLTITYGDGEQLVFTVKPVVTVEVTYLVRIALPPDAEVTVQLQDVSRADAPAEVLATETRPTGGANVPFTFELPYDPAAIEDGNSYAVHAQIWSGDTLLFTTNQHYPVLTQGHPNSVTVVLVPVG
ncbi:MAG: META domain-containing protein [Anaerolineae bacterium]|nr:META domain-containing protein [Anaerolineae bacterium]